MRLSYSTQSDAQARQDKIFADMQGKLEPGTTSWAIPYQDTDANGQPIGTNWYLTVDDRCRGVLTDAEVTEAGFPVDSVI